MTRAPDNSLPRSGHFGLEPLADGVYAAIARDGGGAVGNAGIVDLGGSTLIFDTFLTPQAAEDLRDAAKRLTGRAPMLVVNSHFHGDHVGGNQAFPGAAIYSTARTRELMAFRDEHWLERARAHLPPRLRALEARLEAGGPAPGSHSALAGEVDLLRQRLASLPDLEPRLPDRTFADGMELRGSRRRVELIEYAGGHTESDAVLYLPDDGTLFMGDLLFVGAHPSLWFGDPGLWIRALRHAEGLRFSTAVPGHGPVGAREDLARLRGYLSAVISLSVDAVEGGMSVEEAAEVPVPRAYAGLDGAGDTFARNVRHAYDWLRTW